MGKLLEIARQYKTRHNYKNVTDDEIELAVAYYRGYVSPIQAAKAINVHRSIVYWRMHAVLRSAIIMGKVELKYKIK